MAGTGHCPLTPMTGRVCCPSGFAYVHATSKSYVTVAHCAIEVRRDIGRRKLESESAILAGNREKATIELFATSSNSVKLQPKKR
jgi:hypothetical protein